MYILYIQNTYMLLTNKQWQATQWKVITVKYLNYIETKNTNFVYLVCFTGDFKFYSRFSIIWRLKAELTLKSSIIPGVNGWNNSFSPGKTASHKTCELRINYTIPQTRIVMFLFQVNKRSRYWYIYWSAVVRTADKLLLLRLYLTGMCSVRTFNFLD